MAHIVRDGKGYGRKTRQPVRGRYLRLNSTDHRWYTTAVRHQSEQLDDGSQLSPRVENRTVEGFVIQPDIFERDLSFADTILK